MERVVQGPQLPGFTEAGGLRRGFVWGCPEGHFQGLLTQALPSIGSVPPKQLSLRSLRSLFITVEWR